MHKYIKFSFNATINALKGYQFCMVFLALAVMVDFILSLCKVKLPEQIQMVFDALYKFQSSFYKPDTSVLPADFTLAIVAIELLILAGITVYVIYFVIEFEQIYDKVHKDHCQRYERSFNTNLERNAKKVENQNREFVLFYDLKIEKAASDFMFDDAKPIDTDAKTVEYKVSFKNFLLQNFGGTFLQTQNGYLLFFNDITQSDAIFNKIYEFKAKTTELMKQMKLRFSLKTAVCIGKQSDRQETYLLKLQKLLSIAVPNKIMTLGDFKTKYQELANKTYILDELGEYSIGAEIIEVYSLSPSRQ